MPQSQGALGRALGVARAVAVPISLAALAFLALIHQVTDWYEIDTKTT